MRSGIVAPGDSVLGTDYSSRRILIEGADEAATHPKLFGRESSLCEDFPGLRSVQTSPWCSLGNANMDANQKVRKTIDWQKVTSFFRLIAIEKGNDKDRIRERRNEAVWTS